MTDSEIRQSVHRKLLRRYHTAPDTLVIDELGLHHGSSRADIAVVNGRLLGYEIKSDHDSLVRLKNQIRSYDAVFDSVSIIVGAKHLSVICRRVPRHWGIVIAAPGKRGGIHFHTKRRPRANPRVNVVSVAQLLWKNEAQEIVREITSCTKILRERRSRLYQYLRNNVPEDKVRREVRRRLRNRLNWRGRQPPFRCDGSFPLDATG